MGVIMNEKIIDIWEHDIIISEQTDENATQSDAFLDYDLIYDTCYNAYYDALTDYFSNNPINYNVSYNATLSDAPLEYATNTDARLYTVEVADAPTSSVQATEAYILDIRNIILFACIVWIVVIFYSKIKNLMINYTTKD